MVAAPSHFKFWLFLLLVISSCAKKSHPSIESSGIAIDTTSSFVDGISLDSMVFASGRKLWLISGSIVSNGIEYPFQSVYTRNPKHENVKALQIQAPECLDVRESDSVTFVMTQASSLVTLSWKVNDHFLLVRTTFTSGH